MCKRVCWEDWYPEDIISALLIIMLPLMFIISIAIALGSYTTIRTTCIEAGGRIEHNECITTPVEEVKEEPSGKTD